MDNYKIKVKDEARANEARDLFKALGYHPDNSSYEPYVEWVAVFEDRSGSFYSLNMDLDECEELTLPQLRDLVATKNKTVREFLEPQEDGTYKYVEWTCLTCPPEDYVEIPKGAEIAYKGIYSDDIYFTTEDWKTEWVKGVLTPRITPLHKQYKDLVVWSLFTSNEIKDPALISGAEALRALADGKEVIGKAKDYESEWLDATHWTLTAFLEDTVYFKLKPTTLRVNAELPKPQKETQHNSLVYAVTYEFKTREERNAFADKLRGTNS